MRGALAACANYIDAMGSLENYEYDLVTIGAGSGGTRASRISAQHYGSQSGLRGAALWLSLF